MRSLNLFSIVLFFALFACRKDVPYSDNLDCDDPYSGLLLNFPFDEQGGSSAFDCSPNKINGVLHGVEWAIAEGGKTAVEFDGNDTLEIPIVINGSELSYLPDFGTISVTFSFRNFDGDIQPIVYYGESDAGSPHNSLIIEVGHKMDTNNRKLYFTIVNERFCFDSYVNLEENTWYHFVAVVSSAGNTGYLNGAEMSDRHYNLGSDSTYTDFFSSVTVKEVFALGYGRYGMCDDFFHLDGFIGDFRIYNRALTSREVNDLYHKLVLNL